MAEHIIMAAARRGRLIFTCNHPLRHGDIIIKMARDEQIDAMAIEQGFITSEGRFVDRQEAMNIAKAAGQIKPGYKTFQPNTLFSEDLW